MSRTIRISDNTLERLSKYGNFTDSFDKVINRVLNLAEHNEQHATAGCED